MKLIKKLLLFVLLLGIVAGTLVGCTSDTNSGETINISTLAELETAQEIGHWHAFLTGQLHVK